MSVNLEKGGNVSLTKIAADKGIAIGRLVVACGWDANKKLFGRAYDLDLSCAGLDSSNQVPNRMDSTDLDYQEWFIFANHRHDTANSVRFMGDNRTGKGEGDDEQIKVDVDRLPADIERVIFGVVIWRAEERKQRFGNINNAFIRVFDERTQTEFSRYNLSGDEFSDETFVKFGELYRRGPEWKFRAIGQGYDAARYRAEHGIQRPFETEYARYDD